MSKSKHLRPYLFVRSWCPLALVTAASSCSVELGVASGWQSPSSIAASVSGLPVGIQTPSASKPAQAKAADAAGTQASKAEQAKAAEAAGTQASKAEQAKAADAAGTQASKPAQANAADAAGTQASRTAQAEMANSAETGENLEPPAPRAEEPTSTAATLEPSPEKFFKQPSAARSVLAMQPYSEISKLEVLDLQGRTVHVSLNNVAPGTGIWYVLSFRGEGHVGKGLSKAKLHLEVDDGGWRVTLDSNFPNGLVLTSGQQRLECALWGDKHDALAKAIRQESTYASLCNDRLRLRGSKDGHRSSREWVAEFLRDRVPGGEGITNAVKDLVVKDAFLEEANTESLPDVHSGAPPGAPQAPMIRPKAQQKAFTASQLGLRPLNRDPRGRLSSGKWYAIAEQPGVFISALRPGDVDSAVVEAQKGRVNKLDSVETKALAYLVAFDLDSYDLNYGLGTEHPRVGWSVRALPEVVDKRIPGPDGYGALDPFKRTGRVSPKRARGIVATFTGGFKLRHGAFRWGELSRVNGGSHYGFVEEGVVLSSLKPDLATAIVWNNGEVSLKTWQPEDNARINDIRFARQNGVPIVERNPEDGSIRPGAHVRSWSSGNWSGSAKKKFRTLRAGLCLQDAESGRFLIYGYFSGATASAMARVFQAYQCEYAMMLDMNALEHTYMAIYTSVDGNPEIHHLNRGMSQLDKVGPGGTKLPRFVAFADNRDFFYLTRKRR